MFCRGIIFFLTLCFFQSSAWANSTLQALDRYIQKTLETWDIPGLAVGIVHKNQVIFLRGYGVRKLGAPEKVTPETLFRIGSVSKTFAAPLVAHFVEKKGLLWQDDLRKLLPTLAPLSSSLAQVTLKDLVGNSTGYPRHTLTHLLDQRKPFSEILKELPAIKPLCPAGRRYTYQNVLFSLSGSVCEQISGSSFGDLLHTHLFQPLGMRTASASCQAFKRAPNKAFPHKKIDETYHPLDYNCGYYDVGPAAGINASAEDMTKWLIEFITESPKVISSEARKYIFTPHITTNDEIHRWRSVWRTRRLKNAAYGLGWRILDYEGTPLFFHGGMLTGYSASLGILPHQKIGIIVLTNVGRTDVTGMIMAKFFDLVLGLPALDYNALKKEQNLLNKIPPPPRVKPVLLGSKRRK